MAKSVVGVDLGGGSVKLVELERTAEGIQLIRAKFFDLTNHAEQDKREGSIGGGLEGLFRTEKIKSEKSAISLSGQSVFIRFLKLPRIQKGKRDKIVKYEAQQQVPFPLEKIIWDYQAFRFVEAPEEDILLVAVKNEIVESALNYFSGTKLDIEFIDVSPLSLFNAITFNEPLKRGVILDIGAKATNLTIVEEKGIWVRSILIAGDEMTHAISTKLQLPFNKAEELKRKEGAVSTGEASSPADSASAGGNVSSILTPLVSDLVSSVIQSLEFYRTRYNRDVAFNELILCGGGSKLKGIEEFLSKYLNMEVRRPSLSKKIKCPTSLAMDLDFQTKFGAAIGVALRLLQRCPISIDLLPTQKKIERDFKKKRIYVIASGLLLALIPFTLALYISSQVRIFKTQLKTLNGLLSEYEDVQRQIISLNSEIKNTKETIKPFEKLMVNKSLWLEVLLELEKLLPRDAWITALRTDVDFVILEGKTTSTLVAITELTNKLEASKLFESVKIISAVLQETIEGEGQIRNFSIRFKLKGQI